jgi:hypothetical protein
VIFSEFDNVVSNGKIPNTWNSLIRVYVTDYNCENCGKIKRFKEKTAKGL